MGWGKLMCWNWLAAVAISFYNYSCKILKPDKEVGAISVNLAGKDSEPTTVKDIKLAFLYAIEVRIYYFMLILCYIVKTSSLLHVAQLSNLI